MIIGRKREDVFYNEEESDFNFLIQTEKRTRVVFLYMNEKNEYVNFHACIYNEETFIKLKCPKGYIACLSIDCEIHLEFEKEE